MTQATPTIGANQTGLAYRAADNDGKKALLNHHKGSTIPPYAETGIIWLDDAATPWLLKIYDGTDWITIASINAVTNAIEAYHGTTGLRLLNYAPDTGAANAYAIAPVPPITAYATGQIVTLKPTNANTGAATINVSSLGIKSIKLLDGTDPAANALLTTGVYPLIYDGMNFVLLSQTINLATLGAAALSSAQSFSGGQRTNATALTSSAASIAINLALNNDFTHALAENTTLANPSNIVTGQKGRLFLTQNAGTPRTLAYGSFYKFPGGTIPSLSTTVNAVDVLYYDVLSGTQIACNLVKGFA